MDSCPCILTAMGENHLWGFHRRLCDWVVIISPRDFNMFVPFSIHCLRWCWNQMNASLAPVSSGVISSIVATATTSSRKACFMTAKSSGVCLLFAVEAFLLTNFIQASKWYMYAHSQLNMIWPPNSASCHRSIDITIPLAAATATKAVTIPPWSWMFFKYNCTWSPMVFPKSRGRPFFLGGILAPSSSELPPCSFRRSKYASLIGFDSWFGLFSPNFL